MATLKLFKLLLDKDIDKQIVKQQIKNEVHQGISPKLFDILENIPTTIGIFYVHNDKGNIIFIGKSSNIRKKLNQIFTADTKIAKRIQKEVYTVTFEETGNELIALLKEREELLHNKPVLNPTQRKSPFLWSVYQEKLENGYETLKIHKSDGRKNAVQSFKNQKGALQFINDLYKENEIVEEVQNALSSAENINYPTVLHNELFSSLLTSNKLKHNNIIIVLKGRNLNEKSAVVIENGVFKGFCFFDLNYQILNAQVLSKILIPLIYTKDVLNTVKHYLYTKKDYKIISF